MIQLINVTDEKECFKLKKWLGMKAYSLSNECDSGERKKWLQKAYENLKGAHELVEEDDEVLGGLAAATGRLAEESDVRSKIRLGFEFKGYLDNAIARDKETDPEHTFELSHMRGRLAYTVLTMPLIERLLARTFGAIPAVTVEGAVADLKKAASLQPNVAENELFVAKCLILKGDYQEARLCLNKAINCPVYSKIEQEYIREAEKLAQSIRNK